MMDIKAAVRSLIRSRIAKNAVWIVAGKVLQMLISFVVGLLTARYLGPSNYGLIGYGGAYTVFFYCFCTLGINSVVVKELITKPEKEGEILGTALVLRGLSSFLSAIAIMLIVHVVDAGEKTTIAVVSLCSIGMVFQVLDLFSYWFQSKLQSKVTAVVALISYSITAGYKIFLLATGKSVVYFAFAASVDHIVSGVLQFVVYRQYGGKRLRFSLAYGKELLRISTPFILPSLMVAIYGQTDKLMLKQMISQAEIGYYTTAMTLCTTWCFVLSAIIDSMYPSIMEAYGRSREEFDRKNRLLYTIVIYISLTVSLGLVLLSRPIILLLYGESYAPAVGPLRIITWLTAFSYLGVARNAWIVCTNRQKYLKYVYFGGALSNVLLNLLLIPRWGASGAAVASLAAQMTTSLIVPLFIPALRENAVMMLEAFAMKGLRRVSLRKERS